MSFKKKQYNEMKDFIDRMNVSGLDGAKQAEYLNYLESMANDMEFYEAAKAVLDKKIELAQLEVDCSQSFT
jgi:hypothetical protein